MKFKAILKCNCVFVYPSKEGLFAYLRNTLVFLSTKLAYLISSSYFISEVLNATSDNLATENNLAELKGCQQVGYCKGK